jgi:hypothetical protein
MVDAGPVPFAYSVNVGYVTVTVCPPGTSGTSVACQTIDHVTVDTGSYGLRLLNSVLSSNLILPPVVSGSGQAIAECVPFVLGTTWGSVRSADIYIGGEVARSVPIQDIGDNPGGSLSVPTDCSSKGNLEVTLAQLGSNGILGVGPFINDCDACLSQVIPATYYACTSSGCKNSTVKSEQVVRNPVASFATDKNGVLLNLPSVGDSGSTGLTGELIFGIGTQTNNALGSVTLYAIDPTTGNFETRLNNLPLTSYSYIDSGSNGIFFNYPAMSRCSVNTWAFCPSPSPYSLSAQSISYPYTGSAGPTINFTIVAADNLFTNTNIVAGNIGGPSGSSNTFAWGLPFFYGRPVFTAIAGVTVAGVQQGPYWAY